MLHIAVDPAALMDVGADLWLAWYLQWCLQMGEAQKQLCFHSRGYTMHKYHAPATVTEMHSQNYFSSPNQLSWICLWGGGISENNPCILYRIICILYRNAYTEISTQKFLYVCIIFFMLQVVLLGVTFSLGTLFSNSH